MKMSFYLLKSDYKRAKIGDVLLDRSEISSVRLLESKDDDSGAPIYKVMVDMKNGDTVGAKFHKVETAKKIIKEILGENVSDSDLEDLMPIA
jgi:hypothetical protein